jgi:hypothetical protein
LDWLKKQKPEIVFDASKLQSQPEWVAAGGVIFDTPFDFGPIDEVRDPNWYLEVKPPVTKEGTITAYRYIIREQGKVEVGLTACGSCHSRVMPDSSVIKGAQGNFPIEADYAYRLRKAGKLDDFRKLDSGLAFPDMTKDEMNKGFYTRSIEQVAGAHEAMIPGVVARSGFSVFDMPKIADLLNLA